MRRRDVGDLATANRAVAALELPPPVWRSCAWKPRELIEEGLRQWVRCCAAALRDGEVIGMPSHAVDEAWHGFILCTARYAAFCEAAYGRFLHHHPEGSGSGGGGSMEEHRRNVVACSSPSPARPRAWDLDTRVGVEAPWGIHPTASPRSSAYAAASSCSAPSTTSCVFGEPGNTRSCLAVDDERRALDAPEACRSSSSPSTPYASATAWSVSAEQREVERNLSWNPRPRPCPARRRGPSLRRRRSGRMLRLGRASRRVARR
jgi:hypothetical protein